MKEKYLNKGRVKQKLETREAILSKALELMNGGENFTLENVAKASGLSRATVYRYYSNVETLTAEAGLNIKTKKPEEIIEGLKQLDFKDKLFGVQEYFNSLAFNNEKAFRNYLSIVTVSDKKENKRGARRKRTLDLILTDTNLSDEAKNDLQNLFTILMGIEPIIVAKDVCGLDTAQSKRLLHLGMELILKGILKDETNNNG